VGDKALFSSVLAQIDFALGKVDIPFALIGGIAVVLRGYDRTTKDIDILVIDADERLDELILELSKQGIKLRLHDGLEFARKHRILLLESRDGTPIDLSLGALPFEVEAVNNASVENVAEGLSLPVSRVEDLVIMKAVANRERDWDDIRRLCEINTNLDIERISETVRGYADLLDQPEIVERLKEILKV